MNDEGNGNRDGNRQTRQDGLVHGVKETRQPLPSSQPSPVTPDGGAAPPAPPVTAPKK
jgi:hypothetical protein